MLIAYRHSDAVVTATIFLYACMIGSASPQAAGTLPTTAQMAKSIAQTIDANTTRSANGPIAFQSVTAHDNIVELEYVAKDATAFANNKTNAEASRLALARYYCSGNRVGFLNAGVVIHQVLLAPDNRDRVEIAIDRKSCANLAGPKLAGAEDLARMAQAIATQENAEKSLAKTPGPFQFDAARAHDGVVELHHVIVDAPVGKEVKTNSGWMIGGLDGYFCTKYGDRIGQGLSIHDTMTLADGSLVVDFTIDRSSCGL